MRGQRSMTDHAKAPFTPEQVASLNAYQVSGFMHPFTCGADGCRGIRLIAAENGWRCASQACDYRQDWAHEFMADWSWRAAFEAQQEAWRLGAEFEAHADESLTLANETFEVAAETWPAE